MYNTIVLVCFLKKKDVLGQRFCVFKILKEQFFQRMIPESSKDPTVGVFKHHWKPKHYLLFRGSVILTVGLFVYGSSFPFKGGRVYSLRADYIFEKYMRMRCLICEFS